METQHEHARIGEYVRRFVPFSDDDLNAVCDKLVKRRVNKGNYLMEAGEICDYVAFINKGLFRTVCVVNEKEMTYNFFFDGNFITDYPSFLGRKPSIESHQALEDADVLLLSYADMQAIYEQVPVWQKFGRLIAEFIIMGIAQRNQNLLFLSPEEHYLDLMKSRPKVIAHIPQHYIASYLGIQPESLSRIRKRLAESRKL